MTGPDDEMTAALARTLRHHAAEAPSVDGLPEKAAALASRRRRRRINASIAAIVVLAAGIPVAVVATTGGTGGTGGTPPVAEQAGSGWRWESYRGVQVQVPSDWAYGVLGQAWCAAPPEGEIRPGAVGRPGIVPTIGCSAEYPPANQRENWLTFGGKQVGERRFDNGWVEETREVNGVFITAFTNDDTLRSAILDSAQPVVGTDRYGCPSDPKGYRPHGGLPPASTVESISVCRYTTASDTASPLLSSARIAGEDAKELVDAIRSAPEGEGPDVENADPASEATEIIVLRVHTADGTREVVMHYSGQSGNGFDDGTTKHELTADTVRPLLTGANCPTQMSMPVANLLQG
jgi:hypothetical protein